MKNTSIRVYQYCFDRLDKLETISAVLTATSSSNYQRTMSPNMYALTLLAASASIAFSQSTTLCDQYATYTSGSYVINNNLWYSSPEYLVLCQTSADPTALLIAGANPPAPAPSAPTSTTPPLPAYPGTQPGPGAATTTASRATPTRNTCSTRNSSVRLAALRHRCSGVRTIRM
jgi:hypothetical protein